MLSLGVANNSSTSVSATGSETGSIAWWNETWSRKWLEVANHELLRMTNSHWLEFEPPSCDQHYLFALLYAVLMIPGIVGNAVVILLFFRSPGLRVPANVLNVNLAIADLIMNLEAPILIYNSLSCGPKDFSVLGCKLYGLSGGLSGCVAILSITGMAIQRYISISRPFDGGQLINMKNCLIVVLFTWVYGFTFSFMPVIGFLNRYVPEGYLTACSFDYMSRSLENKCFVLLIFTAAYVLPLCTIVLSYGAIILKVRRTQQRFLSVISANSPRKLSSIHMSLRLGNSAMAAAAAADHPASMARATAVRAKTVDSSHSGSSSSSRCGNNIKSPTHSAHSCPAVLLPVSEAGCSSGVHCPMTADMGRPLSAASGQSTASAYQRSMIESKARTEMKLIRCAATLIAVWTIAWTPYATIALMGVFCPDSGLITPLSSMLPALFCKAASVVDPYIYSCSHPKYRSEIRSLVRRVARVCGLMTGRRRRTAPSLSVSMSRRASVPADQHLAMMMMTDPLPVIACPTPASDEDSDDDRDSDCRS